MKRVKITKYASDICWWMGCIGQECEVVEAHEPPLSKFHVFRIKVKKNDPAVIGDGNYELEGYIPFNCVEIIE